MKTEGSTLLPEDPCLAISATITTAENTKATTKASQYGGYVILLRRVSHDGQ